MILTQKTDVTPEKQRIVFRGKRLKDEESIGELGLEEGHVVHLIASLEHRLSESAPSMNSGVSQPPSMQPLQEPTPPANFPPIEEPVLGEVAEQEIVAGILRTLSRLEMT